MVGAQTRLKTDAFAGPLNEARASSTAGGGTALTTTAVVVGILNGTSHVGLITTTFSTAVVAKFALNPYLCELVTSDDLATYANVTDYSVQGQQPGGTGMVLNSLATLANGGAIYFGSHVPFRGLAVDMSAAVNVNASTLAAHYWNGTAWVTLAPTDGTASAGATFAQDGNITWTVPTAWAADFLSNTKILKPANYNVPVTQRQTLLPYNDVARYWARLTVSAALDSTTTATTIFALNRSTAYAEQLENSLLQMRVMKEPGGVACLELLTDAGTAKAIVNCYTDPTLNFGA